jgi:hypothetical protein
MQESGILPAVFTLAIMLLNTASLLTAVFYYLAIFLVFVAIDNSLIQS